ncbi:hypothetical protein QR680_000024 [Steinernema hermaphroditum]|uniref:RING-type domain-containing protein n=1 Tax=Steinernema hermaphroditum TaxID=289476 RepID=A0AA39LDB5_9BILA|nr:hypothetical protein QR680_000024 [Steinernema hermaphroditum]
MSSDAPQRKKNSESRKNQGRGQGNKRNTNGGENSSLSTSQKTRIPKQVTLSTEQQEALFEKIAATERTDHCGFPFQGTPKECVICCKVSDLFGVGDCRHPVCMECAIRMRIISDQESCPQCRGNIVVMHFVEASHDDWNSYSLPTQFVDHPDSTAFNIRFASEYAKTAYDRYLSHTCRICNKGKEEFIAPTFEALRHHYGQKHRQFFCHICNDNLRLFSWERKTYSREALQMHMKKGDKDDKSFKGHPSCLFCTERFFDNEQQYKHLRKDHFFCQICEADGVTSVFYKEMAELLTHYQKEHFPCTNDECKQMGIVFRSELELNLHTASEHNNNGRPVLVSLDFRFSDRNLGISHRVRPRENDSQRTVTENPPPAELAPASSRPINAVSAAPSQTEQPRIIPSALVTTAASQIVIVPSAQGRNRPIPGAYAHRNSFNVTTNDFPTLAGEVRPSSTKHGTSGFSSSASRSSTTFKKPTPIAQPRPQPMVIKKTSSNRHQVDDDGPSFSGRSSPPPIREAKPKITMIPATPAVRTSRPMPAQLSGPINSKSHFPSLSGSTVDTSKVNTNWGKNISLAKKPAAAESKKGKKDLPKPDIWPDLMLPSGSHGLQKPITSLKDASFAFLQSTNKSEHAQAQQEHRSQTDDTNSARCESQADGKKKKKKKNNVTVVSLADLDHRYGAR